MLFISDPGKIFQCVIVQFGGYWANFSQSLLFLGDRGVVFCCCSSSAPRFQVVIFPADAFLYLKPAWPFPSYFDIIKKPFSAKQQASLDMFFSENLGDS